MQKYTTSLLVAVSALFIMAGMVRAQNYSFSSDLSLGSSSSDVASLQTWLIGNGYDIPSVSSGVTAKGYFGQQTRAALARYQSEHNIPATGYFGPITRGYVNGNGGGNDGDNGNQKALTLQVLSPNGGETWTKGTTQNITWTGSVAALSQTGDIKLAYPLPACANPNNPVRCMVKMMAPMTIASGVSLNQRAYAWKVGNIQTYIPAGADISSSPIAPDGSYKIQICSTNSSICAESANTFTISSTPTPTGNRPIINGVDAPTTLAVGQVGTWSVHAIDPLNGTLKYSVDWGEGPCIQGYICSPIASSAASPLFVQTSTFTHSYVNAGVYRINFVVTNSNGLSSQTSATVQVTNSANTAGPLRITSPNGGENWVIGTTQNITWTSPYYIRAAYADLKITKKLVCVTQVCPMIAYAPITIASGISINQNSYAWVVGNGLPMAATNSTLNQSISAGDYTLSICETGTSNCDYSDNTFTISNSGGGTAGPLQITSPNGGEVWTKGMTKNITWTSPAYFRATYADLKLVPKSPCVSGKVCNMMALAPYTIASGISINQNSFKWNVGSIQSYAPDPTAYPSSPIAPDGQYTIQICETGTSNCDSSDNLFVITSGQTIVQPDINLTSQNNGQPLPIGSSINISWKLDGTVLPSYRVLLYLKSTNKSGGGVIGVYNPSVNGNSVAWTVPAHMVMGDLLSDVVPGTSYVIRAELYDGVPSTGFSFTVPQSSAKLLAYDESDIPFVVTSGSVVSNLPDINIVSPNGGEVWPVGTNQNVTVSLTGDPTKIGDYVDLTLTPSNPIGSSYYRLGTFKVDSTVGKKTFSVSIPQVVVSGKYWIYATLGKSAVANCTFPMTCMTSPTLQAYDYTDGQITLQSNFYLNNQCPVGYSCAPITSNLLKVCPTQKIVDQMPTVGPVSGNRTYYIYNGKRYELTDFDSSWVGANCSVPTTVAL